MFKRPIFQEILGRLKEPRRFIQVLAGPRQAGKTTLARQIMENLEAPCHYVSADDPALRDPVWIEQQWEIGRIQSREAGRAGAVLILDEVQKVGNWSEVVKRHWDEDSLNDVPLKILLLGSAPLLIHKGLTESLAGRFEIVRVTHWSFGEMQEAFGWDLDKFVFFGGYPGAAPLTIEGDRWASYIKDSIIETTLSRDILLLTRVDKPALLRRLFQLGCDYSGQILSFQKMLGQLQDAGNTITLAHYLDLLSGAGMLTGLQKYSGKRIRQKASSPKLLVLNTALLSAQSVLSFDEARADREFWGRLVESAVGGHLVNQSAGTGIEIYYWLDRGKEVDFILRRGGFLVAIEVKSGRTRQRLQGLDTFDGKFRPQRKLLVGSEGIPLNEFLKTPVSHWVRE